MIYTIKLFIDNNCIFFIVNMIYFFRKKGTVNILKKLSDDEYINGFKELMTDLLTHPLVKSMDQYNHHGTISTLFHSTNVAFNIYKMCVNKGMDKDEIKEITDAAMLHDFYLYDWPTQKHDENHIFFHPKESVRNIDRTEIIELSDMQRQMILRHMYPAAKAPNSKGGWMLTLTDKFCATSELTIGKKCFEDNFNKIYGDILNG